MITLLHGDYVEASRRELLHLRNSYRDTEIRELNSANTDESSLIQALESHSLFNTKSVVIIENIFGKMGRKIKLIEKMASIIRKSGSQTDIILWEDREIGKTVISSLGPSTKIILFKIPPLIFKFLDNLIPNNRQILIHLFSDLQSQDAPELIQTMIVRRIRLLIQLCDHFIPPGLPSWQTAKLTSQSRHFTLKKLLLMYKRLLDIEYAVKSGNSAFTLTQHIELFLTDL
jgi:DNA polymerase III delta subunit